VVPPVLEENAAAGVVPLVWRGPAVEEDEVFEDDDSEDLTVKNLGLKYT